MWVIWRNLGQGDWIWPGLPGLPGLNLVQPGSPDLSRWNSVQPGLPGWNSVQPGSPVLPGWNSVPPGSPGCLLYVSWL